MKKRMLLGAAAFVALASGAAWSAGLFPGFPVAGGSAYCDGYSNGNCSSTIPAGTPNLTGEEMIPADTKLAGGAYPQTELIPSSMLAGSSNKLYGGDLDIALSQRLATTKGIASLAGVSPTAAIMANDGFWLINQSSEATVTIASGSTEALPALGTTKAVRIARPSGQSPTTATCTGQTLDQATSAALLGKNAVFSFYGLNGATMSAAGGAVTASISYSSGTAASAQTTLGYAGSEGSKYALGATGQAGTPTNWTVATPLLSPGYDTGASISSGIVTIPMSTTWTRYSIAALIPTVIPGTSTAVTDVSVSICFNPVATTSVTTDWIELQGIQLEAKASTVQETLPNGIISPSSFEKRNIATEQLIEYSYWYYNFENQATITTVASCTDVSTTISNCLINYPVAMRVVPVVKWTDGFQIFTTTGYSAVNACSSLGYSASYATVGTTRGFLMNCTATTVPAAGTANNLTTLGTSSATGIIVASALP